MLKNQIRFRKVAKVLFLSNKCFVLDKIVCFLSSTVDKMDKDGSAKKHMAYRKKHKAYILKYKALILK